VVLIGAFLAALAATGAAMWLAPRIGLLDHPGELKVQTKPIPYLGGLGVAAGLAVGVAGAHPALLLPLALALALGVIDDARQIGPLTRLAVEIGVGLTAAAVVPIRFPGLLGVAGVTVAVVVLINGVNMIDGLDALAAGVGLAAAIGFAIVLEGDERLVALALVGALAGFLVFNRPPARIYLGDGGAYLLGTALALLLALAWRSPQPVTLSLGALLLVACPTAELGFAVLRRVRSRSPLFAGDRSHIYDQLVDRGRSRPAAAGTYIVTQFVLAAVAVGAVHRATLAAGLAVGGCGVALFALVGAFGFLAPTPRENAA
jgi:UDP-N-acetylmuramyl pentapeptide phosphotransferase/UDP-N-acetylglucosamine-1-phosphate transferase